MLPHSCLRAPGAALLLSLAACQSAPTAAERAQLLSLETTLQRLNQHEAAQARAGLARMERSVAINRYQARDVQELQQAVAIQTRTNALAAGLQARCRQLHAGAAAALLAPGGADSLQRELNEYATSLKRWVPQQLPLAPDANDDVALREAVGKQLKDQRFGAVHLEGADPVAAAAELAYLEANVHRAAAQALGEQFKKVGAAFLVFDKIGPWVVPEAQRVLPGDTYRARLLLTRSAYGLRPTMRANGQPVPVGPDGRGTVAIAVPGAAPVGPASWVGEARLRYRAADTTLRVRVPYVIRRY